MQDHDSAVDCPTQTMTVACTFRGSSELADRAAVTDVWHHFGPGRRPTDMDVRRTNGHDRARSLPHTYDGRMTPVRRPYDTTTEPAHTRTTDILVRRCAAEQLPLASRLADRAEVTEVWHHFGPGRRPDGHGCPSYKRIRPRLMPAHTPRTTDILVRRCAVEQLPLATRVRCADRAAVTDVWHQTGPGRRPDGHGCPSYKRIRPCAAPLRTHPYDGLDLTQLPAHTPRRPASRRCPGVPEKSIGAPISAGSTSEPTAEHIITNDMHPCTCRAVASM